MNLLAIFHHQYLRISHLMKVMVRGLYRWVINISPDGDFNYIDNVGMFQRTEKGDFSDCCDGSSVTSFRGIDPYGLECDNLTRTAISCTTETRVRAHTSEVVFTRLLRTLKQSVGENEWESTSFTYLVEFFEFVDRCCGPVEACQFESLFFACQ